jgi:hypothetical protein
MEMNHEEAYRILDIKPPFTEQELKSCFRKKAHELHPDKGGNEKLFIKAKEAYELLVEDAGKDKVVNPILRTVDGILVESLGKGLRVSARKCYGCGGKGYQVEEYFPQFTRPLSIYDYVMLLLSIEQGNVRAETAYIVCPSCKGSGEIALFNPVFIKGGLTQKERKRASK